MRAPAVCAESPHDHRAEKQSDRLLAPAQRSLDGDEVATLSSSFQAREVERRQARLQAHQVASRRA